MKDIAIVGAGLSGLTAALRLTQAGYRPRVFERYPKPGGLARVLEIGGEPIEAFYHHLFTTDRSYVNLAEELGLAEAIEWLPSRMGIWTEERLWDFGTPVSLLKFSPIPWIDKVRFVVSTLRLQRASDAAPFEEITAADWIRRNQGTSVWRSVWEPLLHQKFSHQAEEVAMVWLWRKVYLRGRSRSAGGFGERLGYMKGSFARLVEALAHRVTAGGGSLHLTDPVRRVDRADDGFRVRTAKGEFAADIVLDAIPFPDHLEISGHLLRDAERANMEALQATSALCTVLLLRHSLTPYYWLNIADRSMPFGGLIEHTNYIPRERYGGQRILYISNYVFGDDPLYRAPRADVLASYLPALQRVNPAFHEGWIQDVHHFRADYAQPVVTRGYRRRIPPMRTSVPRLYLCSMGQIYPEDRGQNYAVEYGDRVARTMLEDLGS